MKHCYKSRLWLTLWTMVLIAGCDEIDSVKITNARIAFYRNNDSAVESQAESRFKALLPSQMQFVQDWLNANKAGWKSHNPMATLLPRWCMELTKDTGKVVVFCRYGEKVVLRDLESQVEKSLSTQDDSLFLLNIEAANSKH